MIIETVMLGHDAHKAREADPIIGYGRLVEYVLGWVSQRRSLLELHSELAHYGTINSDTTVQLDARCRAYLASLKGRERGAVLRSYDDLVETAHELVGCGFMDHGPSTAGWLENHLAIGGLFILGKCEKAGVADDAKWLMAETFRELMRDHAEELSAAMKEAPKRWH